MGWRIMRAAGVLALAVGIGSCVKKESPSSVVTGPPSTTATAPTGKPFKIGYVLHGLNDFTQVIKRGAEDAGKALNVDVEVTGPAGFKAPEGIAMFEGMVQKRKDGLAVVPMPGSVWVRPIGQAVEAGIPVVTANITSPESKATTWFGQDEYNSGVLLGKKIREMLEAQGTKSGKVVLGICAPGEIVLMDRYKGVQKAFEGSGFQVTQPYDVKVENNQNYSQWENLATANRDQVAAIGLCSMDPPNMSKVKKRANGKWLVGGYDLNIETLDAIRDGSLEVTMGQHPYLQGYLPVLALVQHLREGKPLPQGWVNVGTEMVTNDNIDTLYKRESDRAEETKWYADHIVNNFQDLNALAKPLPASH